MPGATRYALLEPFASDLNVRKQLWATGERATISLVAHDFCQLLSVDRPSYIVGDILDLPSAA